MRFVTRSLMGLFLMVVTFGLLAYAGSSVFSALQARWSEEPRSRPARERVLSVPVLAVTPQEIAPEFSSFGEVVSRRTLDLRAPSAGTILSLSDSFVEGGQVTKGEALVQIDPTDARSKRDIAMTERDEAVNEQTDARRALALAEDTLAGAVTQSDLRARALTRQQNLAQRGVVTDAAVETAELAASSAAQAVLSQRQSLASAQSRIDRAETALARRQIALDEAERALQDTTLLAEFSGALADVSVVAGGTLTANERVARLIDPNALEVSFRVSTAQYARLLDDQGQLRPADVRISLDVSGNEIVAQTRISRASASVGEGQTGRVLFAPLTNAPGFRPGDFVTATVIEPPLPRVALLPATAVDASGGVLALGDGDRLEHLATRILRRQGDDVIIQPQGLAGREVVAQRSPLLGAGIRIAPLRKSENGARPAPAQPETVALDDEKRARMIAFVEANKRMPADAKERVLTQLSQPEVPARLVQRLERRMGN